MTWSERLAAICERYCGVRLGLAATEPALRRAVGQRAAALGVPDAEAYVEQLERAPSREAELAALVDGLTTGQTDFFRDARQLDAVARILARTHHGRVLEIWSAGCATGEEPYTLAMLAAELGLKCRILATDINSRFLARARAGVFGLDRIEGLSPARRGAFERVADGVRVPAAAARVVEFRRHNLLDPPPAGTWDLILCRNVFIYFHRARVDAVVARLVPSLRNGGLIVLGAADPWCGHLRDLQVVDVDGQLLYRRAPSDAADRPTPPPAPASAPTPVDDRPHDLVARLSHANVLLAQHDFAGALRAYDRVAADAPLLAEVHCLLGLAHRKLGDHSTAKAALRRALFLDAEFWPAAYLLASCLEREGPADAEFRHTLDLLDRWPGRAPFRSRIAGLRGLELDRTEVEHACRQRLSGKPTG